ncbi:UNVERIFIED_CONTAM: hypothetical protein GTU68_010264 [Idotea baltica]|nr:hypothetical protein [Idotea baltica]
MTSLNAEKVKEFQIKTPFGFIAAKFWNESGQKTPILALHGWMDNAGSWDPICPFLDSDHPLVAIDTVGHGLSSHFQGLGSCITDHLVTIERVLKHLQWDKAILLGHSMGGGSCLLYAGARPEKVEKLIVIDILKPLHVNPDAQPGRTAKSLVGLLDAETKDKMAAPRYSYIEMVEKMVKSYGPSLNAESAKTLLKRGAHRHDDGTYSFTHSPSIKVSNTLSMTLEQQEAFASKVSCEFLFIKAISSFNYFGKDVMRQFLDIYKNSSKNFRFEVVEGTHHVHMNSPEVVAAIINSFLHGEPPSTEAKKRSEEYIESML